MGLNVWFWSISTDGFDTVPTEYMKINLIGLTVASLGLFAIMLSVLYVGAPN